MIFHDREIIKSLSSKQMTFIVQKVIMNLTAIKPAQGHHDNLGINSPMMVVGVQANMHCNKGCLKKDRMIVN